ncbi:UNKNOWN [Stylonychia lemnae]|uniref:Uncharacterized protein n=1 Tax=Stylonychia lemnae TaxID=5949 RepID=A0A078A2N3_STYLE|nr:UNKNOWN [Stylonychia lemnae]|eukprot:CDW75788.1 UNKNOWN [Stylonychia lemnae]
MSRCCNENKCSHFLKCYNKCETNSECGETSSCCSEGYCTHEVICKGNKVIGDNCDKNDECITNLCSQNECKDQDNMFPNKLVVIAVVVAISVLIATCIMYFCFKYLFSDDNRQTTHRNSTDSKKTYQQHLIDQGQSGRNSPFGNSQSSRGQQAQVQKLNFQHLVKKGKANLPNEMKYLVTPIHEFSNEFNTYDSQNINNRSVVSSRVGLLSHDQQLVQRSSWAKDDDYLRNSQNEQDDMIFLPAQIIAGVANDRKSLTKRNTIKETYEKNRERYGNRLEINTAIPNFGGTSRARTSGIDQSRRFGNQYFTLSPRIEDQHQFNESNQDDQRFETENFEMAIQQSSSQGTSKNKNE